MSTTVKPSLSVGRPSRVNKTATLASLAEKPATVRVNFDIDRADHTRLKIYAAKQGRTVKEVLTEFVAQLPSE